MNHQKFHDSAARGFLAALVLMGIFAAPAIAAGQVYSLAELQRLASDQNLLIRMARMDPQIRRAELADARRLENPEIEMAWGRFTPDGAPQAAGISEIAVRWKFPNPFLRARLLQAGRSRITVAEVEAELVRQDVLSGVSAQYHRLRYHQRARDLLEKKHRILLESARIARARAEIGEAREIDALRTGVEVQKCLSALHRSRKQVAVAAGRLNEFLGNTLPPEFSVDNEVEYSPLNLNETEVLQRLEDAPLIRLSLARGEVARSLRRAGKLSFIDAITLFSVGEQEVEGRKWKVGMGVALPLFNRNGPRLRRARWVESRAQLELEHARQHIRADVRRILAEISSLENEISTFRGPVLAQSEQNLSLARRLYREGEIPLVEFLDAQNSHFELQERFAAAVSEWGCRSADLLAILGGVK